VSIIRSPSITAPAASGHLSNVNKACFTSQVWAPYYSTFSLKYVRVFVFVMCFALFLLWLALVLCESCYIKYLPCDLYPLCIQFHEG
jgi:hypothetical protein